MKHEKEKPTPTQTAPTREYIINELLESQFIPNYIKKIADPSDIEFLEDAENDVWLIVLSIPEEKLKGIYNGNLNNLRRFVSGIIHRQIKSTSSSYYRTYKRPLKYIDSTPLTLEEKEDIGVFSNADHSGDTAFADKIKYKPYKTK